MIILRLLFDDGSTRTFKVTSLRDFDAVEWYINRHPEILHVDVLIPSEEENHDNI